MKAVIFGISGQDGFYLSEYLSKLGVSVVGISKSEGNWIKGDISDYFFVERIIKSEMPDYIFQFAAVSDTKHSNLFLNHSAICTGSVNVLEAVNKYSRKSIVFLAASAIQFLNTGVPINEKTDFFANSYYSVARIHNVFLARYFRSLGLNVKVGYLFHHDSPRRSSKHINQYIVRSLKKIAQGKEEFIELGNLDVRKEFNYAGDIIKAIWLVVNQNNHDEVVIGSGKAYSIREWIEYCAKKIGVDYEAYLRYNKSYKSDFSTLVSDPSLLLSLGWKPEIDFHMLADMMIKDVEQA
jgi:GDPmannose 4,6-dehydratase